MAAGNYRPRLVIHGISTTWSSDSRPGSSNITGGTTNHFPGPPEGFVGINVGTSGTTGAGATVTATTTINQYPRLEFFCSTGGSTALGKWWHLCAALSSAASTQMVIFASTCNTT